jgi:hypothetical protein
MMESQPSGTNVFRPNAFLPKDVEPNKEVADTLQFSSNGLNKTDCYITQGGKSLPVANALA